MKECLGLHSQNVADWTKLVYFQRIKKEQFPCAPCMIVTGSDIFDKYQNSKPYRPVHTFPYPCQYSIFCFARARFCICTCNIFALHMQHLLVARAVLWLPVQSSAQGKNYKSRCRLNICRQECTWCKKHTNHKYTEAIDSS